MQHSIKTIAGNFQLEAGPFVSFCERKEVMKHFNLCVAGGVLQASTSVVESLVALYKRKMSLQATERHGLLHQLTQYVCEQKTCSYCQDKLSGPLEDWERKEYKEVLADSIKRMSEIEASIQRGFDLPIKKALLLF